MYTHGSGSGHLTRVNAVYRGFLELGLPLLFYLIAPRSKYLAYRSTGIQFVDLQELPEKLDIFICDWRYQEELANLAQERARRWFGLCRLGKIPRRFPTWFSTIAIEPGVRAQHTVWPIISTFRRDLLSREDSRAQLALPQDRQVVFLFENGCYAKHVERVLRTEVPDDVCVYRSTCNPSADSGTNFQQCYPIARYLNAADLIVSGAGYNVVHEVRTLVPHIARQLLVVGGDDQCRRLKLEPTWPERVDSAAPELARFMVQGL